MRYSFRKARLLSGIMRLYHALLEEAHTLSSGKDACSDCDPWIMETSKRNP